MTSASRARLLSLFADGRLHSGEDAAAALGVSRTAVWKLVAELRDAGVPVESLPRRGYRLREPVELLDPGYLREGAGTPGGGVHADVEVLFDVDSTNEYLQRARPPAPGRPRVVFAELQRAGRGRRGRDWISPFGSGLTFSIAWAFGEVPADLSALGLAIGVAVAEALRAAGADEIMLKWPNDIVWRQRKLGGLLLQLRSEAAAAASVVVGLGLNLRMPADARHRFEARGTTPITDLEAALGGRRCGRNALAARLACAMLHALAQFGRDGYRPFVARWSALDSLSGARVRVIQGDGSVEGTALGADRDGALCVVVDGRTERFYSGDVSLRPEPVCA